MNILDALKLDGRVKMPELVSWTPSTEYKVGDVVEPLGEVVDAGSTLHEPGCTCGFCKMGYVLLVLILILVSPMLFLMNGD